MKLLDREDNILIKELKHSYEALGSHILALWNAVDKNEKNAVLKHILKSFGRTGEIRAFLLALDLNNRDNTTERT